MFAKAAWHLASKDGEHLSDDRLADLVCRELSYPARWAAERHLAHCRQCRLRKEHLEGPRAEGILQLYRDSIDSDLANSREWKLSERPRAAFAQWLQLQVRHAAPGQQRPGSPVPVWIARSRLLSAAPAMSAGVALGLLLAVGFYSLWQQQRVPAITANTLLVRAEQWDLQTAFANPGVVHQTVRIKTASRTTERSVCWDRQGIRHPKCVDSPASDKPIRVVLEPAGVDWDQPISASAYQSWHDRQHVRADRITRTASHLLTLTTTVPDGAVSAESLTVRDSDFHPVARTVDFRDSETVEIAEVDFKVLPWSAEEAALFEPIGSVSDATAKGSPRVFLPRLAEQPPNSDQLDETELAARLVLNQLHADVGEQLEVHRLPDAVEIGGLVETDERKRELSAQLLTIPRVKVSIQSANELSREPAPNGQATVVESASLPDQPSALETYMRERGRSTEESNNVAQQLFNAALTINQESNAIDDLHARFMSTAQLPVIASAILEELLYSHHERLEAALRQERIILAAAASTSPATAGTSAPDAPSLSPSPLPAGAARNLALCKELTQTNTAAVRNAEAIFADMSVVMDRLTAATYREARHSEEHTALGGNK